MELGCILATEIEDALYIVDAGERLHRFNIDREDYANQLTRQQKQATWQLPPDMKVVDVLVEAELLSDTSLLIVSEVYAGVVQLNQTADFPEGGIYEPARILIEASSEAGFTSADVGYSNLLKVPMNESTTGEQLIVLGTADGDIHSWSFEPTASTNSPDTLKKESGGSIEGFASEIRDVRLTDYDRTGFTELLVTTGDDARLLWSSTLIQKLIVDVPEGEDVVVAFGMTSQDAEDNTNHLHATVINGTYVTSSGVVEESMELVGGLVIEDIPTIIGLLVSLLLMILLYVHSEWYVVNTVGILVGSGVIVMLGVSFVPTLIMVFMIAAAVYDAWAVYKSKHMLDLADTMMNLNLPILLVAPQDSDYSMRTERTTVHDAPEQAPRDTVQEVPRERVVAKSNDAMLMGLGDVIFPGMLVLSTLQYVGGDNGFIMAMTTLVGSLIGYSVLMYYVGRGQAQAGLPLLNGGAILGYIVGGLLTIGMAMFQFNISF